MTARMVLRLSVIVQVSSFNSVCGWRRSLRLTRFSVREPVSTSLENALDGSSRVFWALGLPLEAIERRAEIVEHGGKVAVQCGTTAD